MRSARRGCATDDKISVPALSKPGFELQWTSKLDNQPRGVHGLGQGVTASGVTLFVPMSLVTGSSNNVYAIDNDLGYVVWERQFDVALPAPTAGCPGGISAGATRIVRLDGTVSSFRGVRRRAWSSRLSQRCSASPGKACRSKRGQAARDAVPRHRSTPRLVPVPAPVGAVRHRATRPAARARRRAGRSDSWIAARDAGGDSRVPRPDPPASAT